MSELKIVVTGASGRMGRTLIREIAQGSGLTLCGALEMEGHPNLGLDSGTLADMQPNGIKLTADPLLLLADAQAVVDFTTPMVSTMLAELAAQAPSSMSSAPPALTKKVRRGSRPPPAMP
jgi:4-hydroxy-tetrahydrodipicolinate reductase